MVYRAADSLAAYRNLCDTGGAHPVRAAAWGAVVLTIGALAGAYLALVYTDDHNADF